MITLDASALIAHLSPRDPHHAAASRLLLDHADRTLVVHPLTLAEVLVGGARTGRGEEMLADIRALGVGLAPRDEDEPLRLATLRASTGLRLPDCCVLDTARQQASALATFDTALARAAEGLKLAVLP